MRTQFHHVIDMTPTILDDDFSECHDLAAERPDVLHELIGRWWSEADRYGVFPLDDRNFAERAAKYHSAASPRRRRSFVLYPEMSRIPGGVTPLIYDRSYRIDAEVRLREGDEGVLISQGDVNGGHVLYVAEGRLHYEYNHQGARYRVHGEHPLPPGDHVLSMIFTKTGPCQGVAALAVDGRPDGGKEPLTTARYLIGWQGLVLGRDALSPVSWDYPRGFPFTGTIERVRVELDEDVPDAVHETFD